MELRPVDFTGMEEFLSSLGLELPHLIKENPELLGAYLSKRVFFPSHEDCSFLFEGCAIFLERGSFIFVCGEKAVKGNLSDTDKYFISE